MTEPTQSRSFNAWPPANTPENRRDFGCAILDDDKDEDKGCWCGDKIIGGFGQCPQCRAWLS